MCTRDCQSYKVDFFCLFQSCIWNKYLEEIKLPVSFHTSAYFNENSMDKGCKVYCLVRYSTNVLYGKTFLIKSSQMQEYLPEMFVGGPEREREGWKLSQYPGWFDLFFKIKGGMQSPAEYLTCAHGLVDPDPGCYSVSGSVSVVWSGIFQE